MTTPYNGNAAIANLANTIQIQIPVDGDPDSAATFNPAYQKSADYIAALQNAVVTPFAEGFDGATFPPSSPVAAWTAPSSRYGGDSAWVRSTTNPITGTASASAPVPQTASTNSSVGLAVSLSSPSRISFFFAINGNNNNSDHLDFYIDGVLTAQLSTFTTNTLIGGKFVSDVLREGAHTFDWRWVRGGSASVGSEECKIDTVEILSDETWRSDPTRMWLYDEGFSNTSQATVPTASPAIYGSPPWILNTGTNPGKYGQGQINAFAMGAFHLETTATGTQDWAQAIMQSSGGGGFTAAKSPFMEMRAALDSRTANKIFEVGFADNGTPITAGTANFVGWAFDGTNGVTSTLRLRVQLAGAYAAPNNNIDSGLAFADATYFRFGVCWATARGVTSALFTKDGKALAGTGGVPPLISVGLPSVAMTPAMRVHSITAPAVVSADLDWVRVLAMR